MLLFMLPESGHWCKSVQFAATIYCYFGAITCQFGKLSPGIKDSNNLCFSGFSCCHTAPPATEDIVITPSELWNYARSVQLLHAVSFDDYYSLCILLCREAHAHTHMHTHTHTCTQVYLHPVPFIYYVIMRQVTHTCTKHSVIMQLPLSIPLYSVLHQLQAQSKTVGRHLS